MRRLSETEGAIYLLLTGLLLLPIGINSLYSASEGTFTCTRVSGNNGTCQYIEKKIIDTKITDFKLSNIQKAQVGEDYTNNKSHGISVGLYTADGLIYILSGSLPNVPEEKEKSANQINKFLTDTKQQRLKLGYGRSTADLFSAILIITGVGTFLCGALFLVRQRLK